MIKTKYVVGDVVVVDGKQEVVLVVDACQWSLYGQAAVQYKLSDGLWHDEVFI